MVAVWCLLLLSLAAPALGEYEITIKLWDLPQIAKTWAQNKAVELNTGVKAVDLFGEKSNSKVEVAPSELVYTIDENLDVEKVLGTETLKNNEEEESSKYLKKVWSPLADGSWYPLKGLLHNMEVRLKVLSNAPRELLAPQLNNTEVRLDTLKPSQRIASASRNQVAYFNTTLKPGQSIDMEWVVVKRQVSADWNCEITVSGQVGVQFTNDAEPRAFPVTEVFGGEDGFEVRGDDVIFTASGFFYGNSDYNFYTRIV